MVFVCGLWNVNGYAYELLMLTTVYIQKHAAARGGTETGRMINEQTSRLQLGYSQLSVNISLLKYFSLEYQLNFQLSKCSCCHDAIVIDCSQY